MRFQQYALVVCYALLIAARRMRIPGVGFSLTPDYGVAAIYYANGTRVEVARVEGSGTFKALMRKAPSTDLVPDRLSSWPTMLEVLCPILDLYKPELCKRDPDVEAAKDLLRSLKAAVASHLGTTFCYAQIALPDRKWTYQADVVNQALHSIRLHATGHAVNEAPTALWGSEVAAYGRVLYSHTARSILALGYSHSELSAELFSEEDAVIDVMRSNRHDSLGAKNRAQPEYQEQMRAFIEKITERPFGTSYFGDPMSDDIERFLLYGDATRDADFLETLRSVTGSDPSGPHDLDPVFTVAVGAAILGYERMDDWEFDIKPAIGCKWMSSLYADKGEL